MDSQAPQAHVRMDSLLPTVLACVKPRERGALSPRNRAITLVPTSDSKPKSGKEKRAMRRLADPVGFTR